MSIHLVGGGWDAEYFGAVYRTFVAEAEIRAAGAGRVVPRIGVLLVLAEGEASGEVGARYTGALASVASCETVVHAVEEGETFDSPVLSGIDALLVGGGLTPAYLEAVAGLIDEIRLLVADGLPYLGFSAGAAIAADSAILGGWRIGEVPVCPEEAGEDLDEVTVAEGLALVDLAVDAHAVQWGTLARVIAATEAGLLDGAVAIDESTVLIVGDGALRVEGRGSVWQVSEDSAGVLVRTVGS
ncbi:Type 1 glutamine amidotransferase-like domain-containing protein [Lysobacter korlensis]|uniref:Type 1 glutamine amidotransferase-like domain-containing protein n=1 Tax=Lysobacter korlensis TaxID=553636 RepID=A0ABV6RWC0_9GAMM